MRTPTFSGSTVSVASHDTLVKVPKKTPIGSSTNQREKPSVSSKAAKVPRPPNAFILYRKHHHPKIKEAYPDFQNNDICKLKKSYRIAKHFTNKRQPSCWGSSGKQNRKKSGHITRHWQTTKRRNTPKSTPTTNIHHADHASENVEHHHASTPNTQKQPPQQVSQQQAQKQSHTPVLG